MISLSLFLCPYCLAYPVQWQLRCISEVGGFVPARSAAWGAAPWVFPALLREDHMGWGRKVTFSPGWCLGMWFWGVWNQLHHSRCGTHSSFIEETHALCFQPPCLLYLIVSTCRVGSHSPQSVLSLVLFSSGWGWACAHDAEAELGWFVLVFICSCVL